MLTAALHVRVLISFFSLCAAWLLLGPAWALYEWDLRPWFLYLIWSIPFYLLAWVVVGIPLIAAGNRILRIPTLLFIPGGAIAGLLTWISFFVGVALFVEAITTHSSGGPTRLHWSGWQWTRESILLATLSAASGAIAMTLYRVLLAREIRLGTAALEVTPGDQA